MKRNLSVFAFTLLAAALLVVTLPPADRAEADPSNAAAINQDVQNVRIENGAAADHVRFNRGSNGAIVTMSNGAWGYGGQPAADAALAFVTQHYMALGLRPEDVAALRVTRQEKTAGATLVVLQQYVSAVPVLNGSIDVVVTDSGVIASVNNHAVQLGATADSASDATQAAAKAASQWQATLSGVTDKRGFAITTADGSAPKVEMVRTRQGYYHTGTGFRLVHDVVLHYPGPDVNVQHYVDDATGQVLKTRSLTVSFDGTAQVFDPNPLNFSPLRPTGTFVNTSSDALLATRMVTGTLKDISQDSNGQFVLTGPFCRVADIEAPVVPPPTSPTTDFTVPRSSKAFPAANAYRQIDKASRFIHNELGFPSIMNYSLPIDVHGVSGQDNSHYSAGTPSGQGYIGYGDGGVPDAEDGDIVLHEMGHAIQDNQTNGRYLTDGEAGAMGEGWGDFWAATNTYAQSIASGFNPALVGEWDATAYSTSDPPFLRRVDGNKVYPTDITNEVHADGEIWSSALWHVYIGATDAQKNDFLKVVLQSHFLTPSNPTFKQGGQALIDANTLIGGTDFRAAIRASLLARGIFVNKAPGNLKGAIVSNGIQLTWSDNSDIESNYVISRGAGNDAPTDIATINPNSTSYVDQTASSNVSYTYVVKALNPDNANDSPSSTVTITPPAAAAAAPTASSNSGSSSGGSNSGASSGGGGGGGGGCFIATAAYGTPTEAHVVSLRGFRDHVLMQYAAGRWFVATYYHYSPPVADWIREREWARGLVRVGLSPLIFAVENPALAAWLLAFALLFTVRFVAGRRARRRAPVVAV